MRELPLNGREYSALALLTTGVRQSALEQEHQRHAARRRVQRQRPAQHVQQLPDRRRRQQRLRHEQPGLLEPGDAAAARRGRASSRSSPTTRAPSTAASAGATVNVAYRSGTNQLPRRGWEFFRDTALNATGFFKPADRREAAAAAQPVRRRARRTDRQEQGVLLRRLRRLPPEPQASPPFSTIPTRGAAAAASCRSTSAIRAPASSTRPARRFR